MKRNGFTLIELLIAVTVLSMMMLVGYYAYNVIATNWDKQKSAFYDELAISRNVTLLDRVVKGVMPWVIHSGNDGAPMFFFVGDTQRILSVTRNGVFEQNSPEIFRLSIETTENGANNLVYQSQSSDDLTLISAEQSVDFTEKLILLENISDFKVTYFGWPNLNAKNSQQAMTWSDDFSGLDRQLIPYMILITWKQNGAAVTLLAELEYDPTRWLVPYSESLI